MKYPGDSSFSGASKSRRTGGFTLMELIVIVIILGIVAAIMVTKLTPVSSALRSQAFAVKSHIRYVQSRAVKSGNNWGIRCVGGQYWMFSGTNPADTSAEVALPGEAASRVNLTTKGVTVTTFTLIFDRYGIPYTNAATKLPANLTLTVAGISDASVSQSLTVIPETGYVQ